MTCRVAVADAEMLVAETEVSLLRHRVRSLNHLHAMQYASWIEVTSARADLVEKTAIRDAARKYSAWIHQLVTGTHRRESAQATPQNCIFIQLQFPESRAVLGWVNVCECMPDTQALMLDLLEAKANLFLDDSSTCDVERTRMAVLKETLTNLTKAHGNSDEVHLLKIQLSSALARKTLADSQQMLSHAEQRQLLSLIHKARKSIPGVDVVQEFDTPASESLPYHKWRGAILNSEATASGPIDVGNSLHEWSKTTLAASVLLREHGFASSQHARDIRSTEYKLTKSLETAQDRQKFMQAWSARLTTHDVSLVSETLPIEDDADIELSDNILRSPHLLEMACNIFRERTILNARLIGIEYRIAHHHDLIEKLRAQKSPNLRELHQAESMVSTLVGHRRHIEEQLHLARLAQCSIADLELSQQNCGLNLFDIDEEAVRVIVLSASQTRENAVNRSVISERMATSATRRLEDLHSLNEQGYASRSEILAFHIQRDELLSAAEQYTIEAHSSDIDGQLADAAFRLTTQQGFRND